MRGDSAALKSVARTWSMLAAAALLAVLQSGCGRIYRLEGRVVWAGAGIAAGIQELIPGPVPEVGRPVWGARATLFHELLKDGTPNRRSTWQASATADSNGVFKLFSYATPGQRNRVGLEVVADGFVTQYRSYVDFTQPDTQYFLVVLGEAGKSVSARIP